MLFARTESIVWASELEKSLFDENQAEIVVEELYDAVDKQDWNSFTELMCSSEQEYYKYYFANTELQNGIKQIESCSLINTYYVTNDLAEKEWLVNEYPILSTSNEIYSFIAEVDCDVSVESKYFFNGINYFLVVITVENGTLKVVQFNRPSSELITKIVEPELSVESQEYDEQMAGIEVIEYAENGLAINAEKELLVEGFEIVTVENINSESSLFSLTDFPLLSHFSTYSYPSYITVKMNYSGNGQIVDVKTIDYIKNTLPNEWYSTWNTEALKAGAYCVKMVGIYRALNPVSSSGGYDVTQYTQRYVPNTSVTSTNMVIDSIKNCGMGNTYGLLFFPEYAAGTKGSAGTKGCGQLKQWGSQYLATQGYTYKQILNYYYSGSEYSPVGDVMLFTYSIGY